MRMVAAPMENNMEFPQNLKMELLFDPVIPMLELYPKNPETLKRTCAPNVHSSATYNSQVLEAA